MSEHLKHKGPIRVLMGKVGLDGHDRGAKVVISALRDAGMEVIYSGLHQTPAALVRAAVEEDVDLVGVSILSGAHNTLVPKVIEEMANQDMANVPLFVGGIIPEADVESLLQTGVKKVFTPGTPLPEIVEWVKKIART
jgi:methylmalonyl-CoA mutase C-terminal domain/subunit